MLTDSSLTTCTRADEGAWFNYTFLTSKERDNETGLDYFGARYYGSIMGRFTSADPLLSSGSIDDPQTWNRYSYVLNNPLVSTDPLGLFVWGNVSEQDKERIRLALQQAAQNLVKIGNLCGSNSQEYKDANRALSSYGKENVKNGVTVSVGQLKTKGANGETEVAGARVKPTADNPNGQQIKVTFAESAVRGDNLEGTAAHEGSHVADGSEWVTSGFSNAANPTTYQTEFRAFTVESLFLQAGHPNESASTFLQGAFVPGKNPYLPERIFLWNVGWKSADIATLRSANIQKILAHPKIAGGVYQVKPATSGAEGILN